MREAIPNYVVKGENILSRLHSIANDFYGDDTKAFNQAVKDILGYDGIRDIGKNATHYVAFSPEQIKSVFNRGTFDANDPRILYQAFRPDQRAYAQKQGRLANIEGQLADLKGDKSAKDKITDLKREKKLIEKWLDKNPIDLDQTARGKIRLATDKAKATITLFKNGNASTLIHEKGHEWTDQVLRFAGEHDAPEQLKADAATIRKYVGADEGANLTVKQHEKMARGFERYLMEGVAPSKALASVFARFKQWLTAIYRTVEKLRSPISADIRDVFDRMLSVNPEKTIIHPEREIGKDFAEIHETDAKTTKPEHADVIGDYVREERHDVARQKLPPEDVNAIVAGTSNEAKGRGAGSAESNGDAHAPEPVAGENGNAAQPTEVGESGNQIAPESLRPSEKQPVVKSPLYVKVPKEPMRLTDWVKKNGGISDEGGDIRHTIGGAKFRPGLIRKNGKSADYHALGAMEAGYFPEKGGERPTKNEFLDKLNEDLRGTAQYSEHDAQVLQAFHNALDHNGEVDRLAHELSINAKGMTYEAFWDAVAERMSSEKQAKEIADQTDAAAAELAEAEKQAQEFLASRGDAWEPEKDLSDKPRTLEDLEHEREQERTTGKSQQGEASPEPSGIAAVDQGQVQDGIRPRGDGTEPSGRDGEAGGNAEGKRPISNEAKPEAVNFIKKDGKLNDDALNYSLYEDTPDWLQNYFNEYAKTHPELVGQPETLESMAELAKSSGWSEKQIRSFQITQKQSRLEQLASAQLFRQKVYELTEAAKKAASSDKIEDKIAFFEATQDHKRLLDLFEDQKKYSAEASRNLGVRRAIKGLPGMNDALQIAELFQRITEKGIKDFDLELKLFANLEQDKAAVLASHLNKPTFKDMLIEYWINALLSNPVSHVKNMVGNSIVALTSSLETGIAGGIGAVREAFAGKPVDRVYLGEAKERLYAIGQGAKDGVIAAANAFKTETSMTENLTVEQYHRKAIPGIVGKIIRLPSRALMAEDELFKAIAERQEIHALAYREAARLGLDGDAMAEKIAEIIAKPSEKIMELAKKNAEYQTFTKSLGKTGRAIQQFANSHWGAKVVVPFIRTPTNIIKYAGERTPLGIFSREVRANLLGHNGAIARDMQIARIALGTTVSVAVLTMATEGYITGGGPSDPKEMAALRLTGWQPYSFKIGDGYYSYGWADPFATIAGVVADYVEVNKRNQTNNKDNDSLAAMMFASISKNLLGKLSLRGISDFIKAATDSDRYGENYIQSMAGTLVPSGVAQLARTIDPTVRETITSKSDVQDPLIRGTQEALNAIKSRVPGVRETLPAKRDIWGQPIHYEGALGPDMLSPIYESRLNDDPVNKALMRTNYFPAKINHKIEGVQLTDTQYDDFSRVAGQTAKMKLDAIVQMPGFDKLPVFAQHDILKKTIDSTRKSVSTFMMVKNPDILMKAIDEKKKKIGMGQ